MDEGKHRKYQILESNLQPQIQVFKVMKLSCSTMLMQIWSYVD
jgi:hypothetical protein